MDDIPISSTLEPPEDIFARPYVRELLVRIREWERRRSQQQRVEDLYLMARGLVDLYGWTFDLVARYLGQEVGLRTCHGGEITAKYLRNLFLRMRRRL